MTRDVALRLCPFCGEGAALVVSSVTKGPLYAVACAWCFARTSTFMSAPDASDAWNRRSERGLLVPAPVEEENH